MNSDSTLLKLPPVDVECRDDELAPCELLRISVAALLSEPNVKRPQRFDSAFRALEALPLSTDEYQRSRASLQNARTYLAGDEPGAARYELVALSKRLPKLLRDIE